MYAGIDYLTVWSDSSPEANTSFYQNATNWLIGLTPSANTIKTATLYGTKGIRSEGVYVGLGDDRALLNVPGMLAQQAYCELYNPSHKITRMDVQVTSTHGYNKQEPHKPFHEWLAQLDAHKPTTRGRKPDATIAGGYGKGWTTYTGSYGSDILGRIYDKWAQSKDETYKNAVRWEVQCRREYAEMLASRFLMLTYDEITTAIPELVASFYGKRGINPPWAMAYSKLWRSPPKQVWDYERSLVWLESAVKPTIERLTGYVPLDQILTALGLDIAHIRAYTSTQAAQSIIALTSEGTD